MQPTRSCSICTLCLLLLFMNSLLQTLAPPPVSRFTKAVFSATMELYPQKYVWHPKGDFYHEQRAQAHSGPGGPHPAVPDGYLGPDPGHLRRRREVRLRQRVHPRLLCEAGGGVCGGQDRRVHRHRLPQRLRHHRLQVLPGHRRREQRRIGDRHGHQHRLGEGRPV